MSWRRRPTRENSPETPKEHLWLALHDSFEEDDGTWHASSDVGLDGLSGGDVLRRWDHIASRATAITERAIWDRDNEPPRESLVLGVAVTRLARGELGYVSVNVDGVVPRRLPPVALELWPDAVSMYWWVGDHGWDAETVAELAQLLGELHALVPHARLTYEQPNVDEFWGPIKSYLATTR